MAAEYAKCSGCKCLRHITDEYEVYKGTRRKTCLKCKESRNKNRKLYQCEHGREKYKCKECGGGSICDHDRVRSKCKECGGGAICEHGRVRTFCKECGGGSICEHGRQKQQCKECDGSQVCEHDNIKNYCKECDGTSICEHKRIKYTCKECSGSLICEHGNIKDRCKECNPTGYLKFNLSARIRGALKSKKYKKSIEYLGCTIEQFKEHIEFQFETGMSWDNYGEVWHIDHIIPIKYEQGGKEPSLEDTIERLHWTNTQPMFAEENIAKSNKFIGKISEYDKAIKEQCVAFNAFK
jgi:hypothetical protein